MKPTITFYPVGNGDMTLIKLESGRRILIDVNIRNPTDDIRDVSADLRKDLENDSNDRPYVDVMVLSHPDEDHCRGFSDNFHTGPIADYNDKNEPKKIIVLEMWSSPLVFRRASNEHTLCSDAKVWNSEAKRRANKFKTTGVRGDGGDSILILGEDQEGKTDDIQSIVLKSGNRVNGFCNKQESNFSAILFAPLHSNDINEEESLSKNSSSVVMNYSIGVGKTSEAAKFLTGGDAEVIIWEKIWGKYSKTVTDLQYNLLATPHHCSWRTLSSDSWSELKRSAQVNPSARKVLGQALPGAIIVASAKEIKNDNDDPPCIRAKEEYEEILKSCSGTFLNTGVYLSNDQQIPLIFEISEGGLKQVKSSNPPSGGAGGGGATLTTPLHHG